MTIEIRKGTVPEARRLIENPSAGTLRELTARMPNARRTIFDNYNVHTRVDSRSTRSSYVVTDRPQEHTMQAVSRAEGHKSARIQDAYIREQATVLVDGLIGNAPGFTTPAPLSNDARNANVAVIQPMV